MKEIEKQAIEEMAREMCHLSAECKTCQICDEKYHGDGELCYFQCMANEIINHGYRKQNEGEWETSDQLYGDDGVWSIYRCSSCGYNTESYCRDVRDLKYNYCPNCGAKMKGGAE